MVGARDGELGLRAGARFGGESRGGREEERRYVGEGGEGRGELATKA